jgi:hypothetical protein
MDAPPAELLVRLILAVVVSVVFALLLASLPHIRKVPVAPLYRFITVVVGMNAAWRWYILWIGVQSDTDGQWAITMEPIIRTIGNGLLVLLYLSIGLIAVFHIRRSIKKHGAE